MNILIIDRKLNNENWNRKEGEELKRAFEAIGHNVYIAGKNYDNNEHSILDISLKCDFCIISENYWDDWNWFDINSIKIPKALWAIDYYPFYGCYDNMMNLIRCIDCVFVIDKEIIQFNQKITRKKHFYLPYAMTKLFNEIKCEKDIDVSFIGSLNRDRIEIFPQNTNYINGVYGDEYAKAILRSKINLNYSMTNAINGKIFEIISCNGFLITNKTNSIVDMFGDKIITYTTKNELRELVNFYLSNEYNRDIIRNECNIFCQQFHTYENRVCDIIEYMELL